jgi:hypothetical protein|tara:strand:- start:116 stop:262 length:147 start_codon:yes stop_codon:yes gene_type:complete
MIDLIIQMLQIDDFYGESKLIDIAKGKHKITTKFKDKAKQIKRAKSWQ